MTGRILDSVARQIQEKSVVQSCISEESLDFLRHNVGRLVLDRPDAISADQRIPQDFCEFLDILRR